MGQDDHRKYGDDRVRIGFAAGIGGPRLAEKSPSRSRAVARHDAIIGSDGSP